MRNLRASFLSSNDLIELKNTEYYKNEFDFMSPIKKQNEMVATKYLLTKIKEL